MPWSQFEAQVNAMNLSPSVSFKVHQLEKIGSYPEAHTAAAEITTYCIKHGSKCNVSSQPNFDAEVNAVKDAVGNFPALIFVEEDAIDTICWRNGAVVRQREQLLKYEIDTLSQLPHALLYVEGGTSDANNPRQVARVLNASDAYKIRGFFTNDTHFNWAYKEIQFGNKGLVVGPWRSPASW
jgi:hypothetical protein